MFKILLYLMLTQTTLPRVLEYDCMRAASPIVLDGKADDRAWSGAKWTTDFVDIEGDAKPKPRFRTRAKMLWDDTALYIFAEMHEPHVWGTLTERNSIIYRDNDFEVFIDPDGDGLNYYEFEVNALGTIMELTLDKPYIEGGNFKFVTHENVRAAVHVDGTLNDPRDIDRGWSVEIALPWKDLASYRKDVSDPPRENETWRMNFSRVEWTHEIVDGKYRAIPKEKRPEDNWVWSPMGVIDMHRPQRWGRVRFVR